jgi:hypothetical protein
MASEAGRITKRLSRGDLVAAFQEQLVLEPVKLAFQHSNPAASTQLQSFIRRGKSF